MFVYSHDKCALIYDSTFFQLQMFSSLSTKVSVVKAAMSLYMSRSDL